MNFEDNTHFPKGKNDLICEVMSSFVLVNRKDADHLVKTFVMKNIKLNADWEMCLKVQVHSFNRMVA